MVTLTYLNFFFSYMVNPLNTGLNPICHLVALVGARPILHVSRKRVKPLMKIKHALSQRADYIQEKYVSHLAEDCSSLRLLTIMLFWSVTPCSPVGGWVPTFEKNLG